jgi:uroporphyrinogen III methyltransferase/synthase
VIVFIGVAPSGELSPRAAQALTRAQIVVTDPEIAPAVAAATSVEVHAPTGHIDDLLAHARRGVVVRALVARPTFDDRALAEIAAAIDAPLPVEVVPAEEVATLPLLGRRVLVTRATEQAEGTARALRRRGAIPMLAPTIVIGPPADPEPLRRALSALDQYDLVAFTSANGVDGFFAALAEQSRDARALARARVAVIGPGTAAALARHGVRADLIAEEHRGEALAEVAISADAKRVLLPRAAIARNALPDALRARGIHVDVVEAYRTRSPDETALARMRKRLSTNRPDAITFTASSTVERFVEIFPDARDIIAGVVVASIGPITSETCRRLGIEPSLEASPYTIPSLIDSLERFFSAR